MQSLKSRISSLRHRLKRRPESLRRQGVTSLEGVTPLYDRKPPWWAKWTYTLVCADLIMTASACELTFNHWTEIEDVEIPAPEGDEKAEPTKVQQYVMRPIWQRIPIASGQLFVGIVLATLLMASRSRIVRRLYVIPGSSITANPTIQPTFPKEKFLVVQAVHHFRGQGYVSPMKSCSLTKGRDDTEVNIEAKGVKGHFLLGLEGAAIEGKKDVIWNSREALYTSFYGKEGKKLLAKQAWTSGPAAVR